MSHLVVVSNRVAGPNHGKGAEGGLAVALRGALKENGGVLVLSRFAGAAEELDGATIVNPYDTEGLADILETALTMPAGERKERWRGMMQQLRRNDITAWRKGFVAALDAAAPVQ